MSKNRVNKTGACKGRVPAWLIAAALILGMFVPVLGTAADVYIVRDNNGDSIRPHDAPCDKASGWLKMRKAEMRWKGKDYAACWVVLKGTVIVIDEAGDVSPVPAAAFKKEEAV